MPMPFRCPDVQRISCVLQRDVQRLASGCSTATCPTVSGGPSLPRLPSARPPRRNGMSDHQLSSSRKNCNVSAARSARSSHT